jgi:hypothetical protein
VDTDPTEPAPTTPGVTLPPPSSGTSGGSGGIDAGKDSGKKDAGPKPEAGVDAGPPPPVVGAVCTTIDAKATKACGKCGKAETLCIDDGSGKTGKWGDYGACGSEAGECVPGEIVTQDCGNCGKQVKTCNQYCAFSTGTCTGQPPNSCVPGATEYTSASCTTGYRNRTCGTACQWSSFSATCAAPVNEIVFDIGATVNAVTTKLINFSAARQGSRISPFGTCPLSTAPQSGNYPYQYVELRNPTTKSAKVTVFVSTAGVAIDTIMAVYGTPIQPMDDAGRKACTFGVNDQSADTTLTGNTDFSLISGVTIPAGGSVLVYVSTFYENVAAAGEITTGNLNLNAKVETLN